MTLADRTTYQIPKCAYPAYPSLPGVAVAEQPFSSPDHVGGHHHAVHASYTLPPGNSYRHLEARWVVPPSPAASYELHEVYYVFPGLQPPPGQEPVILQPVLQYGYNGRFGSIGSWMAASWHCDNRPGGFCAFGSNAIGASPGDSIFGSIDANACVGGVCTWTVVTLNLDTGERNTWTGDDDEDIYRYAIGGDVEIWNLDTCDQLPENGVFFSSIVLEDASGTVTPSWSHHVNSETQPDCGYSVASSQTTVDLYHNVPPPPTMTVSIDGPSTAEAWSTVKVEADVSNGIPPFDYAWTIEGSPACGNQSSCSGQTGAEGTYTTFKVTVTDASQPAQQDWDSHSVFAEWSGCPECPGPIGETGTVVGR